MNKTKAIAIMTIFVLMLAGLAVAMFVLPDQALSYAERRKLAQALVEGYGLHITGGDYVVCPGGDTCGGRECARHGCARRRCGCGCGEDDFRKEEI